MASGPITLWEIDGKAVEIVTDFIILGSLVKVKSLSRVRLFETPWIAAHQAPLSMGFSRQEHWSGVPLLSSNDQFSGKVRKAVSKVTKSETISEFGNKIYTSNFTKKQRVIGNTTAQ